MSIETISVLIASLAAVALAVVGIIFLRKEPPTNVTGVLQTAEDALTDIEKAAGAAREYVLAAEQLWATGRLEKGNRLYFVVKRLKVLFPDMSESTLEDSVEAAVAWMKTVEGRLIAPGDDEDEEI